jgi:hypothetical protein
MACRVDRRSFLKGTAAAGAAALGVRSLEEKRLLAALVNPAEAAELEDKASEDRSEMPMGKLGDLKISRIIGGGNIISGWCHSRDLMYVSRLAGEYLTEKKKFDTMEEMERRGINTISPDPPQLEFINKYKRERGGNLQLITGVRQDWDFLNNPSWDGPDGLKSWIDMSIDGGSTTMYTQGGYTEHVLKTGDPEKMEIIVKAIDYIKEQGYLAGLGCHDIKVIEVADKLGIDPDYYFKTFHHDQYWSAHPRENREHWSVDSTRYVDHNKSHDNIYDLFPEKTMALMAKRNKPWIAFKTLAAGALKPESAFEFCFKGGADFLSVGMFDFQIVEDIIHAKNTLALDEVKNRQRPWCA